MKKGIIALSVLLGLGLAITEADARWGQGRGMFAPGARYVMHLNRMQERLKLTDAQVAKIYAINKKYQEKYFDNRKDYDKVEEISLQHRKEIKGVLTEEQLKRVDEIRDNRRGRGRRGSGRGFGDCPGPGGW